MGFPLRSNIFKSGTSEQSYFNRFPIQVAVLFSPLQGRPVDINQRDWDDHRGKRKQRFLTLGDAWHVVEIMNNSTEEVFDSIILRCLSRPFPRKLLDDWKKIHEIRNHASHTRPLNRNEYETILENALSPDNLYPLARIKQTLSRKT